MRVRKRIGKFTVEFYDTNSELIQENKIFLDVVFKDLAGNKVAYVKIDPSTGKATVSVSITIRNNQGNKIPISGKYIVPYRSAIDGRQRGSVLIEVINGTGSRTIEFSKFQTGIYVIRTEDILDAQTLEPINAHVVFSKSEIKLAVVE